MLAAEKQRAPRWGAPNRTRVRPTLGGDLGLDLLDLGAVDRDGARLRGLRDLAYEVDMQESVLEARALHLDVVGELEAALEGARGDAAIKDIAAFLGVSAFFSPLTVRVLSLASIERSFSPKPATARVTR